MDKLIGMRVDTHTSHPQEFIDALYEEVFAHHSPDVEVDVVVQIEAEYTPDGERADSFTVLDYRVFRAGDEWFGEYVDDPQLDLAENFIRRAMEMDSYARSAGRKFMFIHKHPEGMPWPSPKDQAVAKVFTSIDFARTPYIPGADHQERTCIFMVVVNRYASTPVHLPDAPTALGVAEIDLGVEQRSWEELLDGDDTEHELFPQIVELRTKFRANLIAAFEAKDAGDRPRFEELERERIEIGREMGRIFREMSGAPDLSEVTNMADALLAALKAAFPDLDIDDIATAADGRSGMITGSLGRDVGPGPFVLPLNPDNIGQPLLPPGFENISEEQKRIFGFQHPKDEPTSPNEIVLPPSDRPDVPDVFHWTD